MLASKQVFSPTPRNRAPPAPTPSEDTATTQAPAKPKPEPEGKPEPEVKPEPEGKPKPERKPEQELETPARLRVALGRLARQLRPTAAGAAAGLTPTSASVLLRVVREGSTRLSEIAEAEGLNPTMLSRAVSYLVDAGLLERTSDERDRRAAWVAPTNRGRKLAERIRRERTEAVGAALAGLGDRDRRRLGDALPALERLADELQHRRRP